MARHTGRLRAADMETFGELGIGPPFTERLADRDIRRPTEIQKQVIPLLAAGTPVIFRSATGTGKTFAYLLPLLQRLLPDRSPAGESPAASPAAAPASGAVAPAGPAAASGAAASPAAATSKSGPRLLICAPTYELCSQIKGEADFLLRPAAADPAAGPALKAALITGAGAMSRQIETLKKERPAIVAGNPGRLLALVRMGRLNLRSLEFLVLDEGDRLTAEELWADTAELVRHIARTRPPAAGGCCMAACSATLAPRSREQLLSLLGASSGGPPRIIETDEQEILRDRIAHWAIFSEERRKIPALRSVLAALRPRKALVFSGRGGQPGNIVSQLQYHHVPAAGLYGDMDKKKRKEAIDGFRSGKISVLVSSDLAARGLDIPGISHVIALDVPAGEGPYIHRAGRTGRAGKRGVMITIGNAEEMQRLVRLEKKLGITVHPRELYGGKVCPIAPPADESAPGQSGYRPSPARQSGSPGMQKPRRGGGVPRPGKG